MSCKFSRKPIHLSLWTYTQNHGTCPKWWKLVVGCVDQYHSAFQQSILWASRGLVEWWPIVVLHLRLLKQEQNYAHNLPLVGTWGFISSRYSKITNNKQHIAGNGSAVLRPTGLVIATVYNNKITKQLYLVLIQVSQPTPNSSQLYSKRTHNVWYGFMGR